MSKFQMLVVAVIIVLVVIGLWFWLTYDPSLHQWGTWGDKKWSQ
jgi:hypothetical protein